MRSSTWAVLITLAVFVIPRPSNAQHRPSLPEQPAQPQMEQQREGECSRWLGRDGQIHSNCEPGGERAQEQRGRPTDQAQEQERCWREADRSGSVQVRCPDSGEATGRGRLENPAPNPRMDRPTDTLERSQGPSGPAMGRSTNQPAR